MPKFNTLNLTDPAVVFTPAQNGATTVWLNAGADLNSGSTVVYSRRPVTPQQTTRKSALSLTIPYSSECSSTCTVTSRGVVLFKLDVVADSRTTNAERKAAYDTFVGLLANSDIEDAVVNNGSFYS